SESGRWDVSVDILLRGRLESMVLQKCRQNRKRTSRPATWNAPRIDTYRENLDGNISPRLLRADGRRGNELTRAWKKSNIPTLRSSNHPVNKSQALDRRWLEPGWPTRLLPESRRKAHMLQLPNLLSG